jgi:alanyl-tRNA synthetase
MTVAELREKYLAFFEGKGHVRIPSAPLVPEHDPSVLFTTAGMHPLVPYLKGQPHPAGKRLTDVQKCLRTTDIDEVGDASHATVFEMLGNWSLGDYFKPEAISWSYEFLTSKDWLGIDSEYLAVSVFAGNESTPRDEESAAVWKELGIPEARIAYLGVEDNWWPAGGKQPGPQGPDTEMFYWTGHEAPPKEFDPTDKRWVEIWNNVFMQFNRDEKGNLSELPQKNVDTGMGLERVVMILNRLSSIYEIDTFQPLMKYIDTCVTRPNERSRRIVADHVKAATFVIGDGVIPSNKDRGYVLRRLIRRAAYHAHVLGMQETTFHQMVDIVARQYGATYPDLKVKSRDIAHVVQEEVYKFGANLRRALLKYEVLRKGSSITPESAFELYATYGLPVDAILDRLREEGVSDYERFQHELTVLIDNHRVKSRTASAGKFKGGLSDHSEMSVKYHTATHLLHQALRTILGDHVLQKGSNITPERLRFDFSHPTKMTDEEIKRVEDLINQKIQEDLPIKREELTVAEAKKRGALGLFEHKYGEKVNVYSIGDFSVEICGGPHVERTGILGTFKITKEESAGAGIRRIKAVLE